MGTDSLTEREEGFRLFDEALELGINTFDSARVYGSEEIIGLWLQSCRRRYDVIIVTKGGFPGRPTFARIVRDCEASLSALRVDYVDCYLLHYDCESLDVNEMMSALDKLHREGKVRTFGLSNFRLERAQRIESSCVDQRIQRPSIISANHGLIPWVSPLWPKAQTLAGSEGKAARAWYESHGYAIFAYSPLARGFFKAKAEGIAVSPHYDCPSNHERYRRANEIANAKGASTAQIALAFLLGQSPYNFAVTGCRDVAHLRLNAFAADIDLSPEVREWIEMSSSEL